VDARDLDEARHRASIARLALWVAGVQPFSFPFVTTHSVNDYAGICLRDAGRASSLHVGMQEGMKSVDGKIEAWPWELSMSIQHRPGTRRVTTALIEGCQAHQWQGLLQQHKLVAALHEAMQAAMLLPTRAQATLHLWTGLEALFPDIQTEVTFRVAINLSLLLPTSAGRSSLFRKTKKLYGIRSKIAHGGVQEIGQSDWEKTWRLVRVVLAAILARGGMPREDSLLEEAFNR
jgi:hypothetical protein